MSAIAHVSGAVFCRADIRNKAQSTLFEIFRQFFRIEPECPWLPDIVNESAHRKGRFPSKYVMMNVCEENLAACRCRRDTPKCRIDRRLGKIVGYPFAHESCRPGKVQASVTHDVHEVLPIEVN
jgi:hypothetical protein